MGLQLKKEWVIPAAVGVVSFAGGGALGYILGLRKKMKALDSQLEEIRSDGVERDFKREDEERRFNKALAQVAYLMEKMAITEVVTEEVTTTITVDQVELPFDHPSNPDFQEVDVNTESNVVNIFPGDDDDWSYQEEVAKREDANPEAPYIIHVDEYDDNEHDHRHSTLTYYSGDQILTDEQDVPIYDPENVVGTVIFGHGSKDPNICYVRNPKLMAEYEVLLDHGHYQVEVLGEQLEERDLKHSKHIMKFRME